MALRKKRGGTFLRRHSYLVGKGAQQVLTFSPSEATDS
jgi:hypothetical protein